MNEFFKSETAFWSTNDGPKQNCIHAFSNTDQNCQFCISPGASNQRFTQIWPADTISNELQTQIGHKIQGDIGWTDPIRGDGIRFGRDEGYSFSQRSKRWCHVPNLPDHYRSKLGCGVGWKKRKIRRFSGRYLCFPMCCGRMAIWRRWSWWHIPIGRIAAVRNFRHIAFAMFIQFFTENSYRSHRTKKFHKSVSKFFYKKWYTLNVS